MADQSDERDDLTPTQVVAFQYDAYLHSVGLDPSWIAGWHAAIKHSVSALAQQLPAPDCRCNAGNDLPFPSQHATLCPRFVHWSTVVDVMRTPPGTVGD